MDYRYGSHTVYHSEYHFVWVTKDRYKVLTGDVARRVRDLVRQTCAIFESKILKGVVRKDQVPMLVSAPPHMAPSESMRWLKGRSSSTLCEECPLLTKRYWGRHGWARGSFCATVGQMTEERITEYLEHHFEPNPSDNLRTENSPRVLDPYPDFQSIGLTHQLELVVV
jgi:putative transposase